MHNLVPIEIIENRIYVIRGQKVMLDRDLADLYSVETRELKQAVKRNYDRFPDDFMFQLTGEELAKWRSQFVTSISDRMGLRWRPYAFTEQGIAMLSSVLRSKRAIKMNITIMRAFVKLRQMLSSHKELADKFHELEKRVQRHDGDIYSIVKAIRRLMTEPKTPKKRIGFVQGKR